jgi:hypothetical protein
MKFGLIGDGYAAQRHRKAIEHVDGVLYWVYDPLKYDHFKLRLELAKLLAVDYVIIASPNYLHYQQTKYVLDNSNAKIICEKPLCMPWEPIIDNDRISVCLQLRYIENLPLKADLVKVSMTRNKAFFDSWKGDPKLSGGNFYEFYIHYIDLSILLNADFEGEVKEEGEQIREIRRNLDNCPGAYQKWDLMKVDMQSLYNTMYEEILEGRGIKPKDIFYLKYILDRNSDIHGFRTSGITDKIFIPRDQLK